MVHIRTILKSYPKAAFIFAAIGMFAVLIGLYLILIVHTSIPTPVRYDTGLKAGTPEFIATFATITKSPVEQGQPVIILNNGDGFVPDLITTINAASSTINFSTYIWKKGEFSDEVFAALTNAARRGVVVSVLFDGYNGKPPKDQLATFKEAGGKVGIFRPPFTDPLSINNRNHRRSIVIDGSTGYIGGIAVADTWLGNGKSEDEWRDTMFKLSGPMARSLERGFADQWLNTTGEVIHISVPTTSETTTNTFVNVTASAGDKNKPIEAAFLLTAASAQKSLYITNPYVLPNEALLGIIEEKAKQGVDVRLLVPGPKTDAKTVRWASRTYYQELLDAGVKIYEYQPSLIHSKAVVIDGTWSLIGSANIDNRSREINDENVFGIEDQTLAEALLRTFNRDLTQSSQILPEVWRKRSAIVRIGMWISGLPRKQY